MLPKAGLWPPGVRVPRVEAATKAESQAGGDLRSRIKSLRSLPALEEEKLGEKDLSVAFDEGKEEEAHQVMWASWKGGIWPLKKEGEAHLQRVQNRAHEKERTRPGELKAPLVVAEEKSSGRFDEGQSKGKKRKKKKKEGQGKRKIVSPRARRKTEGQLRGKDVDEETGQDRLQGVQHLVPGRGDQRGGDLERTAKEKGR